MADDVVADSDARLRRPATPFRLVRVAGTRQLTPRMVRVTLAGPGLEGFGPPQPGASIRLLVPEGRSAQLVLPEWAGNEWLLPDGRRAKEWIRTYTPGELRTADGHPELDIDVVLHGGGVTSDWAERAEPGDAAAVSGPQRGYVPDPEARRFLVGGDESAIPAIRQVLAALPAGAIASVHVEVATPDAQLQLTDRPGIEVTWHPSTPDGAPGDALVAAIESAEIPSGTKVWIAGEAACVQRIRRHLFEVRRIPRGDAHVRGYWKHGRAGGDES